MDQLCTAENESSHFGFGAGDRLALIDGYSYVFRAYHALPGLSRKRDGAPTGALAGYCNMLFKILIENAQKKDKEDRLTHLAVVFDAPGQSFRSEIYPDYKSNRPPAPVDLVPQFEFVRQATNALGVASVEVSGFEADDIIATLVRVAKAVGASVDIYSGDKDLMQLIGDNIRMIDAMKGTVIGSTKVIDKFGVGPNLVGDLLALAGDSADNIPGVAGIGVKTAAELLLRFGNLETLLERAGEITQNKRREKLIEQADIARLSRRLVALNEHVDLPALATKIQPIQPERLLPYLQNMELNTLAKRVSVHFGVEPSAEADSSVSDNSANAAGSSAEASKQGLSLQARTQGALPFSTGADATAQDCPVNCVHVTKTAELSKLAEEILAKGRVAISVLTATTDPMDGRVKGIFLAHDCLTTYFIDFSDAQHGRSDVDQQQDVEFKTEQVTQCLTQVLCNSSVITIGHNLRIDSVALSRCGFDLVSIDDTMLMALVCDSDLASYDLEHLAAHYCKIDDLPKIKFEDSKSGNAATDTAANQYFSEATLLAAANRVSVVLRIWFGLKNRITLARGARVYHTLELPMVPVLSRMQQAGICIDETRLHELSSEFTASMAKLQSEAWELAQQEFNLGSPSQISDLLFGKLGLTGGRKTASGKWSTDAKVLDDLAHSGSELAQTIHSWRQLAKLKNTYTDVLPKFVNPITGRVHTSYSLAAVSTGRLSSINPNLQNIPIRTEDGRKIRQAFVPREGWKLISADYSQIELRVLAHVSAETQLMQAFAEGHDIHAMTAKALLGDPEADPDLRRRAKAINFGIIYGISAHGLAKQIGVSRGEAASFMESYFAAYPRIRHYMEETPNQARRDGYVTTVFGRRIPTPGIAEHRHNVRAAANRFAINARIQGSAADLLRRAMIRLDRQLQQAGLRTRLLLQVHDELVLESPSEEIEAATELVRRVMVSAAMPAVDLSVPLEVDVGIGSNWSASHKN